MSPSPYNMPAHYIIPEPELIFHPERSSDRDHHPLRGLLTYGPFSRSIITQVCDPIRVAFVTATDKADLRRVCCPKSRIVTCPRKEEPTCWSFRGFQ